MVRFITVIPAQNGKICSGKKFRALEIKANTPPTIGRACGTRAHDREITIAPSTGRFRLGTIVANNVDLCRRFCVEHTSSRDMIGTRGFPISQKGKLD